IEDPRDVPGDGAANGPRTFRRAVAAAFEGDGQGVGEEGDGPLAVGADVAGRAVGREGVDEDRATVGLNPDLLDAEALRERAVLAGRGEFLGDVFEDRPGLVPGEPLRSGDVEQRATRR